MDMVSKEEGRVWAGEEELMDRIGSDRGMGEFASGGLLWVAGTESSYNHSINQSINQSLARSLDNRSYLQCILENRTQGSTEVD